MSLSGWITIVFLFSDFINNNMLTIFQCVLGQSMRISKLVKIFREWHSSQALRKGYCETIKRLPGAIQLRGQRYDGAVV